MQCRHIVAVLVIVSLTTTHTLNVKAVSPKNALEEAVKVVIVLKLSPAAGLSNIPAGEMRRVHRALLLHAEE